MFKINLLKYKFNNNTIHMKYSENDHINSIREVEVFFDYLLLELKVNFHPDDKFENYIDIKTNDPSFTATECILFNRLMDESFALCEKEGADIYEIGTDKLFALLNEKVS